MSTSTARVPTANASKYMTQLCKHWSHKFETSLDSYAGRVELPGGHVQFTADDDALLIAISSKNADACQQMKEVVENHLNRFAFREAPLSYHWS